MVVMLMAMMVGSMVIILIVPTKKRERKHDVEELGSNAEQVVVRGVGSTDRPIVDSSHIVLSPTTYFPIHPPHPSLPPPKPSAFPKTSQPSLSANIWVCLQIWCNHYQADTMPKTGKNSEELVDIEHFLGMARMPRGEQDDQLITLFKIVVTTIGDKIMCTGSLLWKFMLYSKWPWRW